MNFSDQINADQDCLTCQQGNLFLADMSTETQGKLQFSGIVNGKETQTLPVRRVLPAGELRARHGEPARVYYWQ